ncbi:hypothetical protein DNK48_36405 [Streptomyces malaysiensis subsp. malaysiensis]|uniref:hypothetical protein n=1 Tax=Streptomyces malaysiensis TaxID=92644 RepID=UPI000BFF2410|nr:hypothetical protein [Streptomyces malaysiensis]ATL81643.1 hypothetical protein SMALA_1408 [Streptomyces malaysiensis]QDL73927.1 hypothetical protein DNK48_36405 [Streptomyces malaysiensis]
MARTPFDAGAEFDRQVRVLTDLGYPELSGLGPERFGALVAPLRARAVAARESRYEPGTGAGDEGRVPCWAGAGRATRNTWLGMASAGTRTGGVEWRKGAPLG